MCKEHKEANGPLSWIAATLVVTAIIIVCIGKAGFFEAKAQTPTPINKRFSHSSLQVDGTPTLVLIDKSTGIACYRVNTNHGGPWSCAQMKQ